MLLLGKGGSMKLVLYDSNPLHCRDRREIFSDLYKASKVIERDGNKLNTQMMVMVIGNMLAMSCKTSLLVLAVNTGSSKGVDKLNDDKKYK